MTTDITDTIFTRLEFGFRANATALQGLEDELMTTMVVARDAGAKWAPSDHWNVVWQKTWDEVMGSARSIHGHLMYMGKLVAGEESNRIEGALAVWDLAQQEDARLLAALRVVRMHAGELPSGSRGEWNQAAQRIESNLETIHTCAQALRVKLELLKQYSAEEVEHLVANMRSGLSSQATASRGQQEAPFDRDYRAAALNRAGDQHVYTGFLDVIKGLSLWVESPDERMRKNRSLTLDEA